MQQFQQFDRKQMRVVEIKITGHASLGNLHIDLRDDAGRAARVVVLAGENGCGKTTLLEAVFGSLAPWELLNSAMHGPHVHGQPRWRLAAGKYRVTLEPDNAFSVETAAPSSVSPVMPQPLLAIEFDGSPVRSGADGRRCGWTDANGNVSRWIGGTLTSTIGRDRACFYSEANVTYAVPPIQSSTALAGDKPPTQGSVQLRYPVRGGANLATEIAQLLVDVQAADDNETARWARDNRDQPVPDDVIDRRMRRFTRAFHSTFPTKRLAGVEQIESEYHVVFEEAGRRTMLAELSTGEKQIVFRGAFLLRQLNDLRGAVVLIDEPELSLHPRWQERIVKFYEEIVADEEGYPAQILLATHSPFVVHGSPDALHVVLHRDPVTGYIKRMSSPSYPGVTSTDVAVHAFHAQVLARAARAASLVLAVEGQTDEALVRLAWCALQGERDMPFELVPMSGARNLSSHLRADDGRGSEILRRFGRPDAPVVGLFDFDEVGFNQWNGAIAVKDAEENWADEAACFARKRRGRSVWGILLPVPPYRSGHASAVLGSQSVLAIELLFEDFHVGDLLVDTAVAGFSPAITRRLAPDTPAGKAAIVNRAKGLPACAFSGFAPIFDMLDRIVRYP